MNETWTKTTTVNGGSPVGPGFVVYERAPGLLGYDLKMARASVGPGWGSLLDVLFEKIEHDKKHNPHLGFASTSITQVKEKYGMLTIYFNLDDKFDFGGDECNRVEGFIEALEAMSKRICEACGAPGSTRGDRSWRLTLCDSCAASDPHTLRMLLEQTEQTE